MIDPVLVGRVGTTIEPTSVSAPGLVHDLDAAIEHDLARERLVGDDLARQLDFSRPGKPTDNAFIESFNGRLRDECLNANWFHSLDEARRVIEEWIEDYNRERPHSRLGGLTPFEYEAAQIRTSRVA